MEKEGRLRAQKRRRKMMAAASAAAAAATEGSERPCRGLSLPEKEGRQWRKTRVKEPRAAVRWRRRKKVVCVRVCV